jgi:glycosyltransferase involved in cell wall biosynthesis
MKLGIDFRFYRPEPYGLANYIAGLWSELMPLLKDSDAFDEVVLFMDARLTDIPDNELDKHLKNWSNIRYHTNSWEKFRLVFSSAGYYTFAEQTIFLNEVNDQECDLMFFFTSNYPVRYNKPFAYFVLDFTHAKLAGTKGIIYQIKTWIQQRMIARGLSHTTHQFFLGSQTLYEAEQRFNKNYSRPDESDYKPATVLWGGVHESYRTQGHASKSRSESVAGLSTYSQGRGSQAQDTLRQHEITQPYGMFISVWKSHKNLSRMVDGFAEFKTKYPDYQLVICGRKDPANMTEINRLQKNKLFKQGDLIFLENLPTEELIYLLDNAEFLIHPSLSEGLGLTLIEAAVRGAPVICSNLPILRDVTNEQAIFFDPENSASITGALEQFVSLSDEEVLELQQNGFDNTSRFTWEGIAEKIHTDLVLVAKNL